MLTVDTVSIESQRIDSLRSRWSLKEIPVDDPLVLTSNNKNLKNKCQVNFELE